MVIVALWGLVRDSCRVLTVVTKRHWLQFSGVRVMSGASCGRQRPLRACSPKRLFIYRPSVSCGSNLSSHTNATLVKQNALSTFQCTFAFCVRNRFECPFEQRWCLENGLRLQLGDIFVALIRCSVVFGIRKPRVRWHKLIELWSG